ncbi:hypothetical protein SJAV_20340 [Sulfurisphaera javensis]|uniref:Uncharacterized protein n=1 Tax=Sulfurisphaera javensis TaxID=2049879 RepID=A0AAT9GTG1_9CREN
MYFILNQGLVQASSPWYEDDGGMTDPNGPTMVQYINITKPDGSFIYESCPRNIWIDPPTGQSNISMEVVLTSPNGVTTSADISLYYSTYILIGRTAPSSNLNTIRIWDWALNKSRAGSWAQKQWIWSTIAVIDSPSGSFTFQYATEGNFWNSVSLQDTWHSIVAFDVTITWYSA